MGEEDLYRKYLRAAEIQEVLKDHFPGRKMDIYGIYAYFPGDRSLRDIHVPRPSVPAGEMSDEVFEAWMLDAPCAIMNPKRFDFQKVFIEEPALFEMTPHNNIYVYRYVNYYQDIVHSHNYYEMFYVFRGQCSLFFEGSRKDLREGDYLIIAPGTLHFMVSDSDNFILNLSLRRSDFEDTFRSELARDNLMALFFRNTLLMKETHGYLLFHTGTDEELKYCLKNVTVESMAGDDYSLGLSNCWMSILLSNIVRKYYTDMEMEPPVYGTQFSHILQYIQHNYEWVTLDRLCAQFNYSKPYICSMFKKNTGQTFSQVLNLQRVRAAAALLREGQHTVEEIAFRVGYSGVDYFSRTFKKVYGIPPATYKSQHGKL